MLMFAELFLLLLSRLPYLYRLFCYVTASTVKWSVDENFLQLLLDSCIVWVRSRVLHWALLLREWMKAWVKARQLVLVVVHVRNYSKLYFNFLKLTDRLTLLILFYVATSASKRGRGRTRGVSLEKSLGSGSGSAKLSVHIPEGECGGVSSTAATLSTKIGMLVRGLIPISVNKWVDVPTEVKEYIMDRVLVWLNS